MKKLIIGLHFSTKNRVVNGMTHGLIHFLHLTMQIKTASSETNAKPQPVLTDDALTIPPTTTKTIRVFVDHFLLQSTSQLRKKAILQCSQLLRLSLSENRCSTEKQDKHKRLQETASRKTHLLLG